MNVPMYRNRMLGYSMDNYESLDHDERERKYKWNETSKKKMKSIPDDVDMEKVAKRVAAIRDILDDRAPAEFYLSDKKFEKILTALDIAKLCVEEHEDLVKKVEKLKDKIDKKNKEIEELER